MLRDDPRPASDDSLASRAIGALRRPAWRAAATRRDWAVAAGVAGLLASAPLATMAGAWWGRALAEGEIAAIARRAAPRMAIVRERDAARAALAPLLARPTLGATLDTLARALPAGAALTRAARGGDGRLAIEVATPDPDRLRAALRRDGAMRGLRDAGQRRGDGAMLVALQEAR